MGQGEKQSTHLAGLTADPEALGALTCAIGRYFRGDIDLFDLGELTEPIAASLGVEEDFMLTTCHIEVLAFLDEIGRIKITNKELEELVRRICDALEPRTPDPAPQGPHRRGP